MPTKQNNKIDPTVTFKVSELINGLQWFQNKYGDLPVVFMEKGKFGTSVALVRSMNSIARVMRLANSGGGIFACALRYRDPDSEYSKHPGVVEHTEKATEPTLKNTQPGIDLSEANEVMP